MEDDLVVVALVKRSGVGGDEVGAVAVVVR